MVKIDIELVETPPEPEEGKTYLIAKVENVVTQRFGYKALRVTLEDERGNRAVTMLWLTERATPTSKIGAFISVLGKDTDEWVGKKIQFVSWRGRNRKIQLAPPS